MQRELDMQTDKRDVRLNIKPRDDFICEVLIEIEMEGDNVGVL